MKCTVLIRFTQQSSDKTTGRYEQELLHAHNLKNVLRWRPDFSLALNYPDAEPDIRTSRLPVTDVRLVVKCEGKTTQKEKEFLSFADFVDFMKQYPVVAKELQFHSAWPEMMK